MKIIVLFGFVCLLACRHQEQAVPPEIEVHAATLFDQVRGQLDFATIKKVIGKENLELWLVQFKGDSNHVYANSARGELLYERKFLGQETGYIEITKGVEKVRLNFSKGTRLSVASSVNYHGGNGFCQREQGESFGSCFESESSEFCDSFISCIALAAQPVVSLVIAFACSCNANN